MALHTGDALPSDDAPRLQHTDSDGIKNTPFVIQAFEPIVEIGRWLRSLVPTRLRFKLHANFIAVHYAYLISMAILSSVVIYGAGLMPYIDALFFAAGSVTQSGLNTIDINKLELYQQITFTLVACVCTPIFIHTFVVFVRLYWFEKRFEKVVQEARDKRRLKITPTLSKSKSQANERDMEQMERNIGRNDIQVLHDTTQPNGLNGTATRTKEEDQEFREKMGLETEARSVTPTPEGSDQSRKASAEGNPTAADGPILEKAGTEPPPDTPASPHHLGLGALRREITFADEPRPLKATQQPQDETDRLPDTPAIAKHIEFIERQQRNARAGSAIRIPGPRDFDQGAMPETLEESDEDLRRLNTACSNSLHRATTEQHRTGMNTAGDSELNGDDHPERVTTHIVFTEPDHPGHRRNQSNLERTTSNTSKMGGLKKIISGRGQFGQNANARHRRNTSATMRPAISEGRASLGRTFTNFTTKAVEPADPMPYLSWTATTGRNSAFIGLTEEQREELGGIEYRALKTLAKVLVLYFVGFHVSGMVLMLPWILHTNPWKTIVAEVGIDPGWWGVFTPASMFNDLGFTLTPDSMISFQRATLPLLYGTFLIIIGNTGFPCMLRFVIWVATKCVRYGSPVWEELRFLLDHPRRCFTLLFPSKATWWLFWVLVILNGLDLILFIILDLNDPAVTDLHPGYRVLVGLFQAASTRTAGFSAVNLAELHPAVQVSYMIMMYISVFPIAISLRRTNVYEEKSLGVYGGSKDDNDEGEGEKSYVGTHLRRQLSFDLWYVFLGLFIIAIVEGDRIQNTNDYAFTMFSVLFEIVSAYGTVGLSLGYPGFNTSFSGQFRVISKLVIAAMMIRGRHRGLPYALDRAILLPSESLQQKEAEDADLRYNKRRTTGFLSDNEDHALSRAATFNNDGHPPQSAASAPDAFMTGAAGGDRSADGIKPVRRRTSGLSSRSENDPYQRRRSLSRVLAGGLSAGPTSFD